MALFFVSIFAMAGVAMEALRGTTHPVLSSFLGAAPSLVFLAGLAILGGLWYLHGEAAGTFRRILALFVVGIPLAGVLGTIQGLEAAPPQWGGFAGRQLSVMLLHVLGLPTVAAAGLALLLAVATGTLAWRLAFSASARPASAAELLARMNASPAAARSHSGERADLEGAVIAAGGAAGGVGLLDVEDAEATVVDEDEGVEVEAALPVAEEDELEEATDEARHEEEAEAPRSVLHGVAATLDPDVELMDPITDLGDELDAEELGEDREIDEVEERYAEIAAADAAASTAERDIETESPPTPETEEEEPLPAAAAPDLVEEAEPEYAASEEDAEEEDAEPLMMAHIAAMFSDEAESDAEETTRASAAVEVAEVQVETAPTRLAEDEEEAREGDLEVLDGDYQDEDEDEEEGADEEAGELWGEDEEDAEDDDEEWEEDGDEEGEWEEWDEDDEDETEDDTPESAAEEELTVAASDEIEPEQGEEPAATILEPVETSPRAEEWVEAEQMAADEVVATAPAAGPFGSPEEDWAAWMEERRPARGVSRPRRREEDDGGQPSLFASPDDLDQDLFDRAVRLVVDEDRCSVAMLQRSLSVSFSEASALIERMQSEGVVGPQLASGRREILAPGRERAQTTDI
jgi:hypothetical protein